MLTYLIIVKQFQVAVCYGVGQDQAEAKTDAARNALNYLKVMAKKSNSGSFNENSSSNGKAAKSNRVLDKPNTQVTAGIQNGVKKT